MLKMSGVRFSNKKSSIKLRSMAVLHVDIVAVVTVENVEIQLLWACDEDNRRCCN